MFLLPEKERPYSPKSPTNRTYADLYASIQRALENGRVTHVEKLRSRAERIKRRAFVAAFFSHHISFTPEENQLPFYLYPRELFEGFAGRSIRRGHDPIPAFERVKRRFEGVYLEEDGTEVPVTGEGRYQKMLYARELRILKEAALKASLQRMVREHKTLSPTEFRERRATLHADWLRQFGWRPEPSDADGFASEGAVG